MDINEKFDVVDKFLTEYGKKGKSDVICPVCKTPLDIKYYGTSYKVVCQTENCLVEGFRGIQTDFLSKKGVKILCKLFYKIYKRVVA